MRQKAFGEREMAEAGASSSKIHVNNECRDFLMTGFHGLPDRSS